MKSQRYFNNTFKNILLLFITCSLLLATLEIFFRIYRPFKFRVKGNKIILPVNKKYIGHTTKTEKLDETIIHAKNSLGFRGEELPEHYGNHLTIVTVGGSTAECFYISDGKTWTDVLGKMLQRNFKHLWINNAGLDGQSTFGHIVLMEDYITKLKPKVVLFLIGSNDRDNSTFNQYEKRMIGKNGNFRPFRWLTYHSEVFGIALNVYRWYNARNRGLTHRVVDFRKLKNVDMNEDEKKLVRQYIERIDYKPFETRLRTLIHISRKNNIEPVFITQPTIYGHAIDDITHINLANIRYGNSHIGELAWEGLERVNNVIRRVGKEEHIMVIDLSKDMPKSSKYYYDFIHFSNEGNDKVAEILYKKLCPFLSEEYNHYLFNTCTNFLPEN